MPNDTLYPIDPDTGERVSEAFDLNGEAIGTGEAVGEFRVVDENGELTGEAVELPDGTLIPASGASILSMTPRDAAGAPVAAGVNVNGKSFAPSGSSGSASAAHPTFPYEETLVESWQSPEPHPDANNPVLSGADVSDISASWVADPFIYAPDANDDFTDYHMFFEVMPSNDGDARIGHTTSTDGYSWTYDQIVLDPSWHVAYPYVFRLDDTYYMSPQGGDRIPLYEASATEFPTTWNLVTEQLVTGRSYSSTDTVFFRWDGDGDGEDEWWMADNTGNTDLYFYYNTGSLEDGDWVGHDNNPVVSGDQTQTRPCGRWIVRDTHIAAYYMDTVAEYGDKVRAWGIDTLTPSSFSQTEYSTSPILEETGSGWNSDRMHHYDPWWVDSEGRWVAAVDGYDGTDWYIGIYHVPTITNNGVTEV